MKEKVKLNKLSEDVIGEGISRRTLDYDTLKEDMSAGSTSRERNRKNILKFKGDTSGVELHMEALQNFNHEAKLHKKRMVVKRVSVSGVQKFKEDAKNSPRYTEDQLNPMGELRKYVKDMK